MNPPIDILDVANAVWNLAHLRLAMIRVQQSVTSPDYLTAWVADDIAMDDVDTVHQIIAGWPK